MAREKYFSARVQDSCSGSYELDEAAIDRHIPALSHIGPQNLRSLKQQERTHKFAGAACISTRAPQDNTPARVNKGVKAFSTIPHGCSTHGGGATRPDPIGGPAGARLLNRRALTPTRRSASVAWPTAHAQYLEENTLLIEAILQNQNLGRLKECVHYQQQLQQNLLYLGVHADMEPDLDLLGKLEFNRHPNRGRAPPAATTSAASTQPLPQATSGRRAPSNSSNRSDASAATAASAAAASAAATSASSASSAAAVDASNALQPLAEQPPLAPPAAPPPAPPLPPPSQAPHPAPPSAAAAATLWQQVWTPLPQLLINERGLLAFEDINPAPGSVLHLLSIPIKFIRDINMLGEGDTALLQNMYDIAQMLVQRMLLARGMDYNEREMMTGFHKPPNITVPWLHMHVMYPKAAIRRRKANRVKFVDERVFQSTESLLLELASL